MLPEPMIKQLMQQVINLIAAGKLDIITDREYPLEQLADAHTCIDKGHKTGNVIIRMTHQLNGYRQAGVKAKRNLQITKHQYAV